MVLVFRVAARLIATMLAVCLAACSGSGGGSNGAPSSPPSTGTLELLAGAPSSYGNADGVGPAASFNGPRGLAVDVGGNVFGADSNNATIRRITPAGEVTTFAGSPGMRGIADGVGRDARFNRPVAVAIDPAGDLFVADNALDIGNGTIRKVTASGVVSTLGVVPMQFASSIAVGVAGTVYVADPLNFVIRMLAPDGQFTVFAGAEGQSGTADGIASEARFGYPTSVAVDPAGNVYVTDQSNNTLRRITPAGAVSTVAGQVGRAGNQNGTVADATFKSPTLVTLDALGNLYVLEAGPFPFLPDLRRITPSGMVTTYPNEGASVGRASGIAAAPQGGIVYYTDWLNDVVERIGPSITRSEFAGSSALPVHFDGVGANSRFVSVGSLVVDAQGNVFVADAELLRKITPAAEVTTFARMYADSLAIDASGTLFAGTAECFVPPRGVPPPCVGTIRRITREGAISPLTPSSNSDGSGMAIERPAGLALDPAGNLYIADGGTATIRKLTPAGDLSTVAGELHATGFVDGPAREARFTNPRDLAIDRAGNLLVIDVNAIRRITPAGTVTTLAGLPSAAGYGDGAGAGARFDTPTGIAVDAEGNAYVADVVNSVVRKVTPAGIVTTVAGTPGIRGFHPGPLPGALLAPNRLAMSGRNLYVAMPSLVAVVRDVP